MKHNKTSILGIVLGIMGLLAGVQGAFASCVGNVYFRAPSDWTQAVFFVENGTMPKTVTTKDENGFFSETTYTSQILRTISVFTARHTI